MTPQQIMTVRTVWSSLVASNVVIVAIGLVGVAHITDPTTLDMRHLVPTDLDAAAIIWAVGFASLGASFAMPTLLARASSSSSSSSSSAAAASAAGLMQRAYTPFILSMALAESCTLSGLVSALFMGSQVTERMLLPAAAAILLSLGRFPTEASFRALVGDDAAR